MTHPEMQHGPAAPNISWLVESDPDEFGRLLGPVMAGARARGVADAFEMLGVAAVLIDGAGRVLHAGGRAERALMPLVHIAGQHLVGVDARTNGSLQALMESVLGTATPSRPVLEIELSDAEGRPRLRMKALRLPPESAPGPQLLHAVVVVTEIPS